VKNPLQWILRDGVLAEACPVKLSRPNLLPELERPDESFWLDRRDRLDPYRVTRYFGRGMDGSPFCKAGYMREGKVWTLDVTPDHSGRSPRLADVLQPAHSVSEAFWVQDSAIAKWKKLKGAKAERRVHPKTGFEYFYTEGGIPFPDKTDGPARTILTGEGGNTPSRFKHIIEPDGDGRFRRLTPIELERLNGFPDDWTAGMPDGRRAFCMGNALVVGLVERIGRVIAQRVAARRKPRCSTAALTRA
jgi:DNA (cytosine-5)-methyltransferase 1